jgi:hypothetical protein
MTYVGACCEQDPALKRERDEFFERLAAYNQQYDVTLNRCECFLRLCACVCVILV